jgi:hypothetical protein
MDHDIKPYIVNEALIEDHRTDGLRSGEGAVAALPDGSLYMLYGSFEGASDYDHANLIERRSYDGGIRWTERRVLMTPPAGSLNVMSTSLAMLQDGRLAAVYLHKRSKKDCRPCFMTSGDGGGTWTEPVGMVAKAGYYVGNNDRLVQLSGGRLLMPVARHADIDGDPFDVWCGCVISDDLGRTWRRGKKEIKIEKRNVIWPKLIDKTRPETTRDIKVGRAACQEPGVVELSDGRVMMWCRSPGGYAFRAFSEDGGETWSPFKAITEFAMPCGPQSIKCLPGSKRLIMLYNDREGIPYNVGQWGWRRPLTIAVSDDDGATWRRHGLLEPDTVPSNCYYSICFQGQNAVFTYYEGVMCVGDGLLGPRNLASLKLKIVRQAYFALG